MLYTVISALLCSHERAAAAFSGVFQFQHSNFLLDKQLISSGYFWLFRIAKKFGLSCSEFSGAVLQ